MAIPVYFLFRYNIFKHLYERQVLVKHCIKRQGTKKKNKKIGNSKIKKKGRITADSAFRGVRDD